MRTLRWSFLLPRKQSPELVAPQAGGGGKDVIYLLSSLRNFGLWWETGNGLGPRVSLWSSPSKLCVWPPLRLFLCSNKCEGWHLMAELTLVPVTWGGQLDAGHQRGCGTGIVLPLTWTSLSSPGPPLEIPRPPYVSPVFKYEHRSVKVTCKYQKKASCADVDAS